MALADRFPGRVRAAIGFHPHHADRVTDVDLSELVRLWSDDRVVAMGEMGLDFHYAFASRENQHRVFRGQLAHAREIDKPLVIHCREAVVETVPLLLEHGFEGRRVVFHCFTGSVAEAELIAQHGWRISFTGIVTFPRSGALHEIAKAYPADQLMVETDSPYLSPVPVRGKHPNEPAHVAHTARFLAELRGERYDELVEQTRRNTAAFFRL
jgi:TatD DNase family protein